MLSHKLVSTPESGVDSIAITWALLDPVMTIVRPIAAFITGALTGILINLFPEEKTELDVVPVVSGCSDACCGPEVTTTASLGERMVAGVRYAFGELLKDIGGWLLLGVLIAGPATNAARLTVVARFWGCQTPWFIWRSSRAARLCLDGW